MTSHQRILVLAPHTDDGEFGAGGAIARWCEEGREVSYAAFSACEEAVSDDFPPDILRKEVLRATEELGIETERVVVMDFRVRRFPDARQEILDAMLELRRQIAPDLVLAPTMNDIHQDHIVIAEESLRAFKSTSILAYELPWNNLTFRCECFVTLATHHVDAKLKAIAHYRSQESRPYSNAEYLRAQMVFRGLQIGVPYAEAFDVVRWRL